MELDAEASRPVTIPDPPEKMEEGVETLLDPGNSAPLGQLSVSDEDKTLAVDEVRI